MRPGWDDADLATKALLISGLQKAAQRGPRLDAIPDWLATAAVPGGRIYRALATLTADRGPGGDDATGPATSSIAALIDPVRPESIVTNLVTYLAALMRAVGGGDGEVSLAFCVLVRQATRTWAKVHQQQAPGLSSYIDDVCQLVPPTTSPELADWWASATPPGDVVDQIRILTIFIGTLFGAAHNTYGSAFSPDTLLDHLRGRG